MCNALFIIKPTIWYIPHTIVAIHICSYLHNGKGYIWPMKFNVSNSMHTHTYLYMDKTFRIFQRISNHHLQSIATPNTSLLISTFYIIIPILYNFSYKTFCRIFVFLSRLRLFFNNANGRYKFSSSIT